jgi:hypothetical protein
MMTNWKGFGTGGCDLILGHCPSIRLERLRQTTKNLIRMSGRQCPESNPKPPEYEVGVLTTRPLLSVATLNVHLTTLFYV